MRFWNPMPPGAYRDLVVVLWVIAVAFAILSLYVAAIDWWNPQYPNVYPGLGA